MTPRPDRLMKPEESERPLSPERAFVVQFREPSGGAGHGFAGRVEHMTSGRAARFASAEELVAFFVDQLNAAPTERS